MKQNKRGWLTIAEAFIAIALIASVLVVLYVRNIPTKSDQVCNLEETILDEIASDVFLRNAIFIGSGAEINDFVKSRTPDGYNFTTRICDINDICGLQNYEQNVCARERIISANLTSYQPKKVKIFMWRE